MSDRRVAVRHDSSQATPCHYALSDRVHCRWAKVHDISRAGIALEMDVSFQPGTRLIVELPGPTYQAIRPVAAQVIRVQQQADGKWLVGCAFAQELNDAELHLLLQ